MKTTFENANVIEILSRRATNLIELAIQHMKDGTITDMETGEVVKCDGIVVLANDTVCPIFRYSDIYLTPLVYVSEETLGVKSLHAMADRAFGSSFIIPDPDSIGNTVAKFNDIIHFNREDSLAQSPRGHVDYAQLIVAYHSFDPNWDK